MMNRVIMARNSVFPIFAILIVGSFLLADFANAAITGAFTANQTIANVSASTLPAIIFSGGADIANGVIPAINFTGGADLVTSNIPAIAFTGGDADNPASSTITIPSSLSANASDHSVTIDGVIIDLGTSALTASQIAAAIAANPFAGKDYTVTNPSGAEVTFTKNAAGLAGNGSLTIQDVSFGTVAQVVTFT